jgi:hypothetical protein
MKYLEGIHPYTDRHEKFVLGPKLLPRNQLAAGIPYQWRFPRSAKAPETPKRARIRLDTSTLSATAGELLLVGRFVARGLRLGRKWINELQDMVRLCI